MVTYEPVVSVGHTLLGDVVYIDTNVYNDVQDTRRGDAYGKG